MDLDFNFEPEDFDSINEFLNDVDHLDIIQESTISRFSNRRERDFSSDDTEEFFKNM